MATRKPLVLTAGQPQQLQAGDVLDAMVVGSFAPGSLTVPTGKYMIMSPQLQLTSTQQVVLAGTAVLRIT